MSEQPAVRYRVIDRHRRSGASLDEQLSGDHPVRLLWRYVDSLDLSGFLRPSKAVEGHPGAPVVPPNLLFALWLFAFTEGSLSARRLSRLCSRDLPYQWLCGGQPVNYHTLSDFYTDNAQALEKLFVEHVAILRQQELISLHTVTLDGRKIPADASKDHYRRQPTLKAHLQQAQEHLQTLKQNHEQEKALGARRCSARQRAAKERVARLQRALAVVRQRQQERQRANRKSMPPEDARASETDPDCAKMKFADGGYRLGYNVETMTDLDSGLIVTVGVTAQRSDNGQLGIMMDQVQQQQGVLPQQVLLDSGFADSDDVERLEKQQTQILMPPKNARAEQAAGRDPYKPKDKDSATLAAWRQRLGTAAAQAQYRQRAPVAEGVHAQHWQRGWNRFGVRGLPKATTVAYWQALAHNVAKLLRQGKLLPGKVRAELA